MRWRTTCLSSFRLETDDWKKTMPPGFLVWLKHESAPCRCCRCSWSCSCCGCSCSRGVGGGCSCFFVLLFLLIFVAVFVVVVVVFVVVVVVVVVAAAVASDGSAGAATVTHGSEQWWWYQHSHYWLYADAYGTDYPASLFIHIIYTKCDIQIHQSSGRFFTVWTRWWFQIFFYVHPHLGKIPSLTHIFLNGLKPPTRNVYTSIIWTILHSVN